MSLNIEKWIRKPFPVDVVKVTQDNMADVADWCDGTLDTMLAKGSNDLIKYIKVRVLRPLTDRQTRAFAGDYVLYTNTGYKVYTEKAFRKDFEEVEDSKPENNGAALNGTSVVVDGTPLSQEAVGFLGILEELKDLLPKKTA